MDTASANRSSHLPGGNLFDDMRVDLAAAYAAQGERLETLALEYLSRELDIRHGALRVGPETVSLCTGTRRREHDRGR